MTTMKTQPLFNRLTRPMTACRQHFLHRAQSSLALSSGPGFPEKKLKLFFFNRKWLQKQTGVRACLQP
jgi:hypothetical protein